MVMNRFTRAAATAAAFAVAAQCAAGTYTLRPLNTPVGFDEAMPLRIVDDGTVVGIGIDSAGA